MTNTAKCESKNTKIECSDAPEMFTVTRKMSGRKSTECLSHAARSEEIGHLAETIRH